MKKILFFIFIVFHFNLFSQESKEITDFKLAVQLYEDKLYNLALEQFKRLAEFYPNTQNGILSRYYLGLTQYKLKNFEEAKAAFQNFAITYQQHPKSPESWWKVSDCFVELGRLSDAAATLERLKTFHPTTETAPLALLKASDYYLECNDIEDAQKVLKVMLQDYGFSPITSLARFKLSEIYERQGLYDLEISELKKISDASDNLSDRIKAKIKISQLYSRLGKIEQSESILNQIIVENKNTVFSDSAFIELSKIRTEIGEYDSSKVLLEKVIDSNFIIRKDTIIPPVKKVALIELSKVLLKMNLYQEFLKYLKYFEGVFRSDTSLSEIYFIAADCYKNLKDYDNSNLYYQKVIDFRNSNKNRFAILYRALNFENQSKYNDCILEYEKFINKYPSDLLIPEILLKQGKIYSEKLSDFRNSIIKFEDLLKKYPSSSLVDDAQYFIANAFELTKDYEKANKAYSELLEKYPCSEFAGQSINRMELLSYFVQINSNLGFQKLGLLMQDLMTDKPKGEIAFKIGEVYFNDLKDYKSAIGQFDITLNSNVNDSVKNLAKYYKILSQYYISINEVTQTSEIKKNIQLFIDASIDTIRKSNLITLLYKLEISNKKNDEIISISESILKKYNYTSDLILYQLSSGYFKLQNYSKSVDYTDSLISKFPQSKFLEEIYYFKSSSFKFLKNDSLSKKYSDEYFNKYPNGRFIAKYLYDFANEYRKNKEFKKSLESLKILQEKYFYINIIQSVRNDIADLYFDLGEYRTAIRLYEQLNQNGEVNPIDTLNIHNGYVFKIATGYEKLENYDNAKKYYQIYIIKYKNGISFNDALFSLGSIYKKEGKEDLSLSYFKQIKSKPEETDILLKMGNLFFESNEWIESASRFRSLLDNSKNAEIQKYCKYKLIILSYKLNNNEEAEKNRKTFEDEYKKIDDYIIEFDYEKGLYLFKENKYEEAIKLFENIIDDYPKNEFAAWSTYWLGKYEESNNQQDKAIKKFEWILTNFPKSKVAFRANLSMGNIFYRSEKYDNAVKYYRNIADFKCEDQEILSSALNNLIICYSEIGIYDAAIEYCRKFINQFPNDNSIIDKKIKIGSLYKNLKYFDQAIIHFQSLMEVIDKSQEAELRYYLGECYFSKGDYEQAIIEFLKISYLNNKDSKLDWSASAFYLAGQSYEKMNKFEQAITMYQQIIDRPGIDNTFKAQAEKEINRVKELLLPNK